jgi:hypothetical protein
MDGGGQGVLSAIRNLNDIIGGMIFRVELNERA